MNTDWVESLEMALYYTMMIVIMAMSIMLS